MFGRWNGFKTNVHVDNTPDSQLDSFGSQILASGSTLDPSCNHTITITCLQHLYGTAGYKPSAGTLNQIGITGFLGEFANIADLQLFYANQTPAALGSNFTLITINGSFSLHFFHSLYLIDIR
jgi:tripeptidyl-peptidase-1